MLKLNKVFKLLLSDAGFVFMASSIASGFSFLTSMLMARILTPNDFGKYTSCITIFNYTVILGTTIQTSTTRTVAQLKVRSGLAGVKHFYWPAISSLFRLGLVLFVILAALSFPVAGFLSVSTWLVVVVFSCAMLFGPMSMTLGTLQGLQNFRLFSISLNVTTTARLLISTVLVIFGLGIWGAVIALPVSTVITIGANAALVFWAMKLHTSAKQKADLETENAAELSESELLKHPLRTFFTTSFFALFGMVSFALVTSLDVLIVRHFYPTGPEAGQYALASTLGKAVLYFTGPIGFVALPKMAHTAELGQNVTATFRRNLWLTVGASLVPLVILAAGSGLLLKLFSNEYSSSNLALLIPLYGVVMMLYGVVSLWIYFFISVGRNSYMFAVVVAAILEVGLLFSFHSSLLETIVMLSIPAILLWVVGEIEIRLYNTNFKKDGNKPANLTPDEAVAIVIGAGKFE